MQVIDIIFAVSKFTNTNPLISSV